MFRSAADRKGEHATGPDMAPLRSTAPKFTLGDYGTLIPGEPTGGGGYDGPALLALADAYLQQRIRPLDDDNPWKAYAAARIPKADFGTMGMGDPQAMHQFAKLAYGRALSEGLRYQLLRDKVEESFGGGRTNPSHAQERFAADSFARFVQPRVRGPRSMAGGAA